MDSRHHEILKRKRLDQWIMSFAVIAIMLTGLAVVFTEKQSDKLGDWFALVLPILAATSGMLVALTMATLLKRQIRVKVFISYAYRDEASVKKLKEELFQHGYTYFDPVTDVLVGDDLSVKIPKMITKADAVVVVLSKSYSHSEWANRELIEALKTSHRIFPVRLEPDAKIPDSLQNVKYLDLSTGNYSELLKALDRIRPSSTRVLAAARAD